MKKPQTSSTRRLPPLESAQPKERCSGANKNGAMTILFAVTGMSPAVLTETIWALAHEAEPVVPDRVVVVTTSAGRNEIERQLFTPMRRFGEQCVWDALRASLAGEGLCLDGRLRFGTTSDDVRVIAGVDGLKGRSVELADIRTPQDSEATADFLLDQLRCIVENPDARLIASLAGGRKTMGALLYACMTLAGRENDRLTHVLVNEPFENLREFYFPAQPGGDLTDRDGAVVSPAQARVELADVTFVPLRNLFLRELGRPAGSFQRLVELCRLNVRRSTGEHLKVEIDRNRTESFINGRRLELAPREHLVLLFFAERAKRKEPVLSAYDEALVDLDEFRKALAASASKNDWTDWRHDLSAPIEPRDLVRVLSDMRSKARRAGGDAAFLADVLPARGRCSLDVPASLIFIKGQ